MADTQTAPGWTWPVAVAVIGLALLGSTWSDAIQGLDGAAVTAACSGDPGSYPLHAWLGRAACALPWFTPAGRVSALSTLAATWTLVALYFSVLVLTGNRWAAGAAALVLLSGRLFWRAGSHAAPWPLGLALAATALWLGLRAAREPRGAVVPAGLAGLCGGLALPALETAPLVLLALLLTSVASGRRAALATVGLALGLAPQVAALGTQRHHLLSWIAAGDLGTLGRFVFGVPAQTGWLLWPISVLGAVALLRHRPGAQRPLDSGLLAPRPAWLARLLGATVLLWGPLRLTLLAAPGNSAQLVPTYLLILGLGVGLSTVHGTWLAGEERGGRRRLWHGAVLVVAGLAALRNQPWADLSRRYAVEDHGINCLSVAGPSALVLGHGGLLRSTVLYAQRVLGHRDDVRYLDLDRVRRDPLRLIQDEQRRGGTVYLARPLKQDFRGRWRGAFAAYPVGPLMRLMPVGASPPSLLEIERINRRVFRGLLRRGELERPELDPDGARLRECYARAWRWIARELDRAGQRKPALRALLGGQRWAPWLAAPGWFDRQR